MKSWRQKALNPCAALAAIASMYQNESAQFDQRMLVWSQGGLPPLCGPISPAQISG